MPRLQRKHLTQKEEDILLRELDRSPQFVHKIILIIFITGVRLSEALKLTYHSLDVAGSCIHIKAAKGSYDRSIPISPQDLVDLVPLAGEARNKNLSFGQLISETKDTCPMSQQKIVQRAWKDFCLEHLGHYPVTIHGLRHSFAMRLLEESKNDLILVQSMLGHKYLENTRKYLQYKKGLDCRDIILKANARKLKMA